MTENVETEVTLPVEIADTETQLLDNLLRCSYKEMKFEIIRNRKRKCSILVKRVIDHLAIDFYLGVSYNGFTVLTLWRLRGQSTRGVKTDIKQQTFRVANFPSES